jgi:hypothetical protein
MQAMKAESATPVKGAATKHCCCGHYDGGENASGHCEDCDVNFWLLARQRQWQPDSQPASQPASPVEGAAMKAMKAKAAAPVKAAAMKEMKAEAATPVKKTAMKAMKATRQPRPKFSEDNRVQPLLGELQRAPLALRGVPWGPPIRHDDHEG